jgi:hypothetical protein
MRSAANRRRPRGSHPVKFRVREPTLPGPTRPRRARRRSHVNHDQIVRANTIVPADTRLRRASIRVPIVRRRRREFRKNIRAVRIVRTERLVPAEKYRARVLSIRARGPRCHVRRAQSHDRTPRKAADIPETGCVTIGKCPPRSRSGRSRMIRNFGIYRRSVRTSSGSACSVSIICRHSSSNASSTGWKPGNT